MKSIAAIGFVALSLSAHAADLTVSAGISKLSSPPGGTWWEPGQPVAFHSYGPEFGVGLRGHAWSVEIAQVGRFTSAAVACAGNEPTCTSGKLPMSHWYGTQRPRGVWGAWEPHYGPVFLQIGGGVYRPGFSMNIPDYATVKGTRELVVGNDLPALSWLGGIGVRSGRFDFITNIRRVAANGPETNAGNFHGLSRTAITANVRVSF